MTKLENFTEPEKYEMGGFEYLRFVTSSTLPFNRHSTAEFFRCGNLKPKGNIYAWGQEEACAGHICRMVGQGVYEVHCIRDDGTVWTINLDAFETITPLDVWIKEDKDGYKR